ncbi:hypothetical protein M9H77_08266 [Catharanthus roseus]|uniref:Uncharacterized protein n=1 Tax=Catharanthus roseus TaxID=4058 RepID=A0ACC0BXE8_CATRO|nr:hypothetical protein M9H77_08266 [Catharanthus roseus]
MNNHDGNCVDNGNDDDNDKENLSNSQLSLLVHNVLTHHSPMQAAIRDSMGEEGEDIARILKTKKLACLSDRLV